MNILVATDGTEQGHAAIGMLKSFQLTETDRIIVVCVVDMAVPLAVDVYGGYLPDTSELEKIARDHAERVLDAGVLAAKDITASTEVIGEILYGPPESRIVEAAEKMPAELIILGSHGYNRWERLLLGSVSISVLHHAPCSVLIVRTSDK